MLGWSKIKSEGSIYSRGKKDYYVISARGIPEERPKNCVIELYATAKKMTISEIKHKTKKGKVTLLSRSVVLGELPSDKGIIEAVEAMKKTAENRENKNRYGSLNSAFTTG